MNLDDVSSFPKIDKQDMLAHIEGLPNQLGSSWRSGLGQPLPSWDGLRYVLISGMGGSAIAADMLSSFAISRCPVPIIVHRDYDLPTWARGPETLVIASSHSGNTEETLTSYDMAGKNGCRRLVIATGGKLAEKANADNVPCWLFKHEGQPRAAVGFAFGLLLAAMTRLALIPNPGQEVSEAVTAMQTLQETLRVDVPVTQNPAKRMAGQFVGRWVTVIGAGCLSPVARRWKGQINELAKAWAQFDFLPEADHNTLAGLENPEEVLSKMIAIFLRSPSDHPRNQTRIELTRKSFMLQGINTDFFEAQGNSALAHIWTTLLFGDYLAYYLAMAYGVDPTPIAAIQAFKEDMK
jgi:glucose/mannose-6-phosphate isomerase